MIKAQVSSFVKIPFPAEAFLNTLEGPVTLEIRKFITYAEDTRIEGFKPTERPWQMFAAAAVIKNPWAGRFVEDLTPEINQFAPQLGRELTDRVVALAGGAEGIEAFGKSAVVGLDGEVEHGSGLIHTLKFGNFYRQAVNATSYLAFCNTRGAANAPVSIPMMDLHDAGRRSHYLTLQFSVPDAPRPDEVLIALGAASSGRPHHRIGDRYQDLKELGHDLDNPAAV